MKKWGEKISLVVVQVVKNSVRIIRINSFPTNVTGRLMFHTLLPQHKIMKIANPFRYFRIGIGFDLPTVKPPQSEHVREIKNAFTWPSLQYRYNALVQ
jgi:hypothetical protein